MPGMSSSVFNPGPSSGGQDYPGDEQDGENTTSEGDSDTRYEQDATPAMDDGSGDFAAG